VARPKRAERAEPAVRAVYLRPWRIDISRAVGVPALLPDITLARTAAAALAAAGAPSPASLALILSDDRELARLNADHMGEDGPTDVLSFPLLPPSGFPTHVGKAPAVASDRPKEPAFNPPRRQRPHLGDIVISVERAIDQADQGRGGQTGDVTWSAADEVRLLVVNGVLHVCGWDHANAEERNAMRALEREVIGRA
jgi:probable rRNA maturation factor